MLRGSSRQDHLSWEDPPSKWMMSIGDLEVISLGENCVSACVLHPPLIADRPSWSVFQNGHTTNDSLEILAFSADSGVWKHLVSSSMFGVLLLSKQIAIVELLSPYSVNQSDGPFLSYAHIPLVLFSRNST